MNKPHPDEKSPAASHAAYEFRAIFRSPSWDVWPEIAVLAANVVATGIVVATYADPFQLDFDLLVFCAYAYVASLILSMVGGLAIALARAKPWWLLTIPWAVVLCAALVIKAQMMNLRIGH